GGAARHAAGAAARDRLTELDDGQPAQVIEHLRRRTEKGNNVAWERLGVGNGREAPSRAYARLRREMLNAEREVFRLARDEGRISEEVLRRAQRDMDLEESMIERSPEP